MENYCVLDGVWSRCSGHDKDKKCSDCKGYEQSKYHGRCIWNPFEDLAMCTNVNLQCEKDCEEKK